MRKWCALALFLLAAGWNLSAAPVTALAWTPDGAALVSVGPRRLDLRSPSSGTVQGNFPCEISRLTSLGFDAAGQVLAVGGGTPGESGEVMLYSWPGRKVLHRLTGNKDLVTSVAFHQDHLGAASADHSARVWKLSETNSAPRELFSLTGHAGPVLGIAFSPSGRTVVTASADRSIKVWSMEDGRLLRTFSHHTEALHALTFRPGNEAEGLQPSCASAGDDRTVRVWQPEIGRMVRIIRGHRGSIFALAYSSDGKFIFSAGEEGIVRRIDADSDTILESWPVADDWIYSMAVSPDGGAGAVGSWSGAVRIVDLKPRE